MDLFATADSDEVLWLSQSLCQTPGRGHGRLQPRVEPEIPAGGASIQADSQNTDPHQASPPRSNLDVDVCGMVDNALLNDVKIFAPRLDTPNFLL